MSGLKLKLKTNTGAANVPSLSTPLPSGLQTPGGLATPGGTRPTIKFNVKGSVPSTPAAVPEPPKPKKTKAGRAPKPSSKLVESKKRPAPDDDDTEEEGSTIQVQPPRQVAKKIKIINGGKAPNLLHRAPQTPGGGLILKAKKQGKTPLRKFGVGYDSEASDKEDDPVIEEQFILRMAPGDDCEYLRKMINEKKIGLARSQGGADIHMKFFDGEARKAAITVRGNVYAATLVDLPTVIEGMKSWDKRGWLKSADICQMLWVYARIQKEDEARLMDPPAIVDAKTHQFPHGLTPPMQFARRNRFRNRLQKNQIEEVESEVNRLLAEDDRYDTTHASYFDLEAEERRASQMSPGSSPGGYGIGEEYSAEEDNEEDAEGEADDSGYFASNHTNGQAVYMDGLEEDLGLVGDEEEDLVMDLDAELDMHVEAETPADSTLAATPMPNGEGSHMGEVDSGDESVEDGDDESEEESEIDEEEHARQIKIQDTKEAIAELESQIAHAQAQSATQQVGGILRKRTDERIVKLKQELQLKKSSIGEGEENE